jgi:hypothetical protein
MDTAKKNHNEKTILFIKDDLSKKGLLAASGIHGLPIEVAKKLNSLSIGEVEQVASTLAANDLIATPFSIAATLSNGINSPEDVFAETAYLSAMKKKTS